MALWLFLTALMTALATRRNRCFGARPLVLVEGNGGGGVGLLAKSVPWYFGSCGWLLSCGNGVALDRTHAFLRCPKPRKVTTPNSPSGDLPDMRTGLLFVRVVQTTTSADRSFEIGRPVSLCHGSGVALDLMADGLEDGVPGAVALDRQPGGRLLLLTTRHASPLIRIWSVERRVLAGWGGVAFVARNCFLLIPCHEITLKGRYPGARNAARGGNRQP